MSKKEGQQYLAVDNSNVNKTNPNDISRGMDISKTKQTIEWGSKNADKYDGPNKDSFCMFKKGIARVVKIERNKNGIIKPEQFQN
jgi:hypothetical protein